MRHALAILLILSPAPAMAMNWEGHDDWMLSFHPDYSLEAFLPGARPLPSRDCPVTEEDVKNNPYEQIPLPRHNCPPAAGRPELAKPAH
jgi:hypothetical protein